MVPTIYGYLDNDSRQKCKVTFLVSGLLHNNVGQPASCNGLFWGFATDFPPIDFVNLLNSQAGTSGTNPR